jgi:enamine deaminase RidA (YjgF/YER057c/UK114 family)
MLRHLTPRKMPSPMAGYSHAVQVTTPARLVFCSGQLGVAANGWVPPTVEEQTALCFDNIRAILAEAGMALGDLVRLNAYVSGREHLAGYMVVRDRYVTAPPPASTLMIVGGFSRPEFVVEVEAIAARAD